MTFSQEELDEQVFVIQQEIGLWRKMLAANDKAYQQKQKEFNQLIKEN